MKGEEQVSQKERVHGALSGAIRCGARRHLIAALALVALSACAHPAHSAPTPVRSAERAQAPAAPRAARASEAVPPPEAALPPTDDLPPPPGEGSSRKRLDLEDGEPTVPVRLMENAREVVFRPRGRMRLLTQGPIQKTLEAPPGSRWRVRLLSGRPAVMRVYVSLAQLRFSDKEGLADAQALWHGRGVRTRAHVLGSLYGIAGKVIDNRRYQLLLDEPLDEDGAARRQAALLRRFGAHTTRFEEVATPATGVMELLDADGHSVALAEGRISAVSLGGEGFDVSQVEYAVGYPSHGFEDRSYRGALELVIDRGGKIAVVNRVALEDLLKGLVPSEIFARAPMEALKAQAVTARGEVLAKIGLQHLADPYLLCSEQHCAVYRGRSGEAASTSRAVEATRGEALFAQDGHLVDSVYSAICGGHTEDNENVWGGVPDPNLRGRPDLLGHASVSPSPDLAAYLKAALPSACHLSTFTNDARYRWTRRIPAAELTRMTASLKVGEVQAIRVLERGVSGRATRIAISGVTGATEVRGELNIRKLFGMLNSSMFVVSVERDAQGRPATWVFTGGGWGHGVGMCQVGAIGRAEAGQSYRDILRFYFSGAEVARIY